MAMITTIARKEFAQVMRDGRFRWTAAMMVLLLLTSILAGWQRYAAYASVQSMAQRNSNAQWLDQGDKNPHSAAHYGNYAFKPLGPLAFFDSGITSYAGTAVFMEAHRQNFAIARPASDTSAVARFGELSGAMILQLLLPLMIIFLGFTAFAGERESGTLRQVLSMGVGRAQLLWGKALGLSAAILLVVVPCLATGAIFLAATGLATVGGGIATRVGLLALAYLLYAAIFLFLTLAVSAWARTARAALMIMVGFWAFTAFIMPKAAAELSKLTQPTPAFGTFIAEMKAHQRRGIDGVSPHAKLARYQAEMFRKYQVSRVEDLPVYWTAVRMQKLEELDQPVFDQHYGAVRESYVAQQRLQDRLGVLAPMLPLRSISMALAGTSLIEQNKFTADAEAFREDMVLKMNDYLSKAAVDLNGINNASTYMVADEKVFAMVPPYQYEPPPLGATVGSQAANFALLAAWLMACVALATLAAARMRLETNR
jgi:ABC-2 type transport system permease protein